MYNCSAGPKAELTNAPVNFFQTSSVQSCIVRMHTYQAVHQTIDSDVTTREQGWNPGVKRPQACLVPERNTLIVLFTIKAYN